MKLKYKRGCLIAMLLLMISAETRAQKFNLLIGTYTNTKKSEGIYVYEFDSKTGKTHYKNKAAGLDNPSYLALSNNEKFVYAVSEAGPGKGGVSAFSFDPVDGRLEFLNKKPSNGDGPCYVAVDKDNRLVFVANYGGGSLSAISISEDGSLTGDAQAIQHQGSSVNRERQDKPHVHSTVVSPDGQFLFVSDLGTDKIYSYRIDSKNAAKPLSPADPAFTEMPAGSGPRHFEFHPVKSFAYSIQELSGNVTAFNYSAGKLEPIQHISMLPQAFSGEIRAADIHISPDGKFLYTSNRGGGNDIAIFQVDGKTGKLTLIGRHPSLGNGPRNFAIDPSGNYLLVANQNSDSVVVLRRNKKTGELKDTGERINVGSPVCLKFSRI